MSRVIVWTAVLLTAAPAAADDLSGVDKALRAKDFYEKGVGTNLTAAEMARLDTIARTEADPAVRLRAQAARAELNGKVRADAADAAVVVAGFRHLEAKADDPGVKALLAAGFTHLTVSAARDGAKMFLIESIVPAGGVGPRGGLNLRYDPAKKAVVNMAAWGDMAGR